MNRSDLIRARLATAAVSAVEALGSATAALDAAAEELDPADLVSSDAWATVRAAEDTAQALTGDLRALASTLGAS